MSSHAVPARARRCCGRGQQCRMRGRAWRFCSKQKGLEGRGGNDATNGSSAGGEGEARVCIGE